jgi:integrase
MVPGPQEDTILGYLRKLGKKKYRIIYDLDMAGGRRRQRTETLLGVTKQQAQALLAKRKNEVSLGELSLRPEVQMNELFDRFMQLKSDRLAPSTLQRYEGLLAVYLRPAFGAMSVGTLKTADLTTTYARWSRRKIGARTVRHAADLMRNVLNRAVKWNLIPRNPASLLDTDDLPRLRKPASAVLSEAELSRLLEEARHPTQRSRKRGYLSAYASFYPAVAFAAFTGARRGEILAVRWCDVDLNDATVTIARSLTDAPRGQLSFKEPKSGKPRTLCLSGQLVAILRSRRAAQAAEKLACRNSYHDEDLVFARPDGFPIPPWNFAEAFGDLVKRARVTRITLHDLRDTHASLLAKSGVPIEVISQRLGHSTISVTVDRYITVYRERDLAAAAAFDRMVS